MSEVGYIEHDAQARLDACHVVGCKFTHFITHRILVHIQLADEMGQLSCIDLHRARCRAETVCGTGLVTIVFVLLSESGGTLRILSGCLQFTDFTLYGDTHTGRKRQTARHTVDFAETALDTFVGALHLFDGLLGGRETRIHQIVAAVGHFVEMVVQHGQRLQALDETFRVVVEDHALVQ